MVKFPTCTIALAVFEVCTNAALPQPTGHDEDRHSPRDTYASATTEVRKTLSTLGVWWVLWPRLVSPGAPLSEAISRTPPPQALDRMYIGHTWRSLAAPDRRMLAHSKRQKHPARPCLRCCTQAHSVRVSQIMCRPRGPFAMCTPA